jgi:succinate dehydrogenase/fumarate reductase flavoprotein subunit
MSDTYDIEADVVVVGYGAGGTAAAITAHDNGANVILLEKMPYPGGNTGVAGGNMTMPHNPEKFREYLTTLCFDITEPELINTFVQGLLNIPDWFKEMGAELRKFAVPSASCSMFIPDITFPGVPGGEDVTVYCMKEADVATSPCGGARIIQVLSEQVKKRNIKVLLSSPATELIQNEGREIVGVKAESEGKEIAIKANKGVILTCGGFENNPTLKRDNIVPKVMLFSGNPGNTGDGIKMIQKIGAATWHMGTGLSRCGLKVPEYDATFSPDYLAPGFIWVDKHGKRFINEGHVDVHLFSEILAEFDNDRFEYTRIPFYAIFDEEVRRKGPVCWGISGPNVIVHNYKWSSDNSVEIKKGWIFKAKSISDLAKQISVNESVLNDTLANYNQNCKEGRDPDFNRPKDVLKALDGPPYYALELWPSMINTQGGPKRDTESRVLDPDGNPIPRLYAAGEFGSIWGFKYQTSTNISEALVYGQIAGKNAATSEPVRP